MTEKSPLEDNNFEEEPDDEFSVDPEDAEEIDEEERESIEQHLVDVRTLKSILGSLGLKGVVVWCPDCEDEHYLGWDLLSGNLQQILTSGRPLVHEPAFQPDPEEYVTWDYACGFLDGYETYPDDSDAAENCGYCGNPLPHGGYEWAYCPSCGRDLSPINLIFELRRQGWKGARIAELLEKSGFDPPLFDPDEIDPSSSN